MKQRKVALILPFDKDSNVILQRRKGFISKPTDRDYGFFGGGLEEGETVEEALKREVMEELTLNVEDMNVKEGKPITIKIEEAINSNISEMDKIVLKEISAHIKQSLKLV